MVTNTKFTSQAIEYSACVGVDLWGWKYPSGKGLESLIDQQRLYPITILPSLTNHLAEVVLNQGIVLVEDILKADPLKLSQKLEIPHPVLIQLTKEAKLL